MATIQDYAKDNFRETAAILLKQDYAGDGDGDKLFDRAEQLITSSIFKPSTDVDLLPEFAKAYLGDMLTRRLIPTAIDYYQAKTRRVDSMGRPSGVTPLGGESSQNYDRVKAMQDLDKLLAGRLAANEDDFLALVADKLLHSDEGTAGVPKISTRRSDMLSQDPEDFGKFTEDRYFGNGFGVIFTGNS